jgi:osmotically-inducible protein OsmY
MTRLHDALAADPDTAPCLDQFSIQAGSPWQIGGTVDSIAARRKAIWIARRVLPEVDHEDRVRLTQEVHKDDHELAQNLRERFEVEPLLQDISILEPGAHPPPLNQPWIGVMVNHGVVYLGGRVEDHTIKGVAEGLAWDTRACSDVVNMICHAPRCNLFDDDMAEAVQTLIRNHPRLAEQQIEVSVKDGVVSLRGEISDPLHRELAKSLSWFVPSVLEVEEQLRVA